MVILGVILIIASFFVYEKNIVLIVGIAALVFGLILMGVEAKRKVKKGYYLRS
jgi:membrane-bound ClpP family serine protease